MTHTASRIMLSEALDGQWCSDEATDRAIGFALVRQSGADAASRRADRICAAVQDASRIQPKDRAPIILDAPEDAPERPRYGRLAVGALIATALFVTAVWADPMGITWAENPHCADPRC